MKRIAAVVSVAWSVAAPVSSNAGEPEWAVWQAEYVQTDEAGEQVEHSVWRCSPSTIVTSCDQGIMVVIDGRPQPVDIGLRYDRRVVHVTAARGVARLAVRGGAPMALRESGFAAATLEIWETLDPRIQPMTRDLVWRPPFRHLATLNLLVQRLSTPRRHLHDSP
jgi:hypothetical protein